MSFKLFSEIFDEFNEAKTKNERVEVLKKNKTPRFLEFVAIYFNKNVKFITDIPEYKTSFDPAGLNYVYLQNEVTKLYRFIENHPKRPAGLSKEKSQMLLIQVLEGLHKDEAKLLCGLIKKDLGIKFFTPKLVKEAYPELNITEE